MAVDPTSFTKSLRPVLKLLHADLVERAKEPGVSAVLKAAWEKEKKAKRTAAGFEPWRRARCMQVAAAWVLSVVFVRTLEDRGLLARRRIFGPGAEDSEAQFIALAPYLTPRDYLLTVFRELAKLPGSEAVFDPRHNPVWVLGPSADAARKLLDAFQKPGKNGEAPPTFEGSDTRFLGDLYQNLDEDVRATYALLQTPEFVEEFILEQTLDPAIDAFGLKEVTLIDPTCGSGHFLLGAFRTLFARHIDAEPTTDRGVLAERALAQVFGVDLNPYAVAIARFRLTLEFLRFAGIERLERCPRLPLNLTVADSLLHGVDGAGLQMAFARQAGEGWGDDLFALEDEAEALRILRGRYHAVVGNPPYINVEDSELSEQYRGLYRSASGPYSLSAPFAERFFMLGSNGGFVGMINSNAFAKREFGEVLICEVLPEQDLAKVVDTSGAYIPGHGTPTLMLFGRSRPPGPTPVRVVMGKRGEREEPPVPDRAPVWLEIREHHDDVGWDGQHVSVEDLPRTEMTRHPWILAGGGARELKALVESRSAGVVGDVASEIGRTTHTGMDPALTFPTRIAERIGGKARSVPIGKGEDVRDWMLSPDESCLFPYDQTTALPAAPTSAGELGQLWPLRTTLRRRKDFGKLIETRIVDGRRLNWWEHSMFFPKRFLRPYSIVFAEVATHNHFVGTSRTVVFRQTSPAIIPNSDVPAVEAAAAVPFLNSSVAAFWGRLVFFLKGGDIVGDGARLSPAPWDRHLQMSATQMARMPLPRLSAAAEVLAALAGRIGEAVIEIEGLAPAVVVSTTMRPGIAAADLRRMQGDTADRLERLRGILVSCQEEIDWRVYGLFGLTTKTLANVEDAFVPVRPEHRPFEVRLAREVTTDISARLWFERHHREPPTDVGGPLADLYRQRLRLIDADKNLQLLEQPENKRRWPPRDYAKEFEQAYREWLCERVEALFRDGEESVLSARAIAAALRRDPKVQAVAEVYKPDVDLEALFSTLVVEEALPYLAAFRYTDSGLEKRRGWEAVWELQRREDAGEKVKIEPADKYATGDFQKATYWRHRGALDVPKERFVLYPQAETESDDTPVIGWAGWDHRQKANALAALYQDRQQNEGWLPAQLVPLVAGLWELVPWLQQWHNEPDPSTGSRVGDAFKDVVSGWARECGVAPADLPKWRPAVTPRRGGRKRKGEG
jgi:hypothetical protein